MFAVFSLFRLKLPRHTVGRLILLFDDEDLTAMKVQANESICSSLRQRGMQGENECGSIGVPRKM